jgi:hypothetical protein
VVNYHDVHWRETVNHNEQQITEKISAAQKKKNSEIKKNAPVPNKTRIPSTICEQEFREFICAKDGI